MPIISVFKYRRGRGFFSPVDLFSVYDPRDDNSVICFDLMSVDCIIQFSLSASAFIIEF